MISDFLTAETFTTFWGLVLGTAIIVQFTKGPLKKKFNDGVIRFYTLIIAGILIYVFANQGVGLEGFLLTFINAITVSIGSFGVYEIVVDPKAEKERID